MKKLTAILLFSIIVLPIGVGAIVHWSTLDGLDGALLSWLFEEDTHYALGYSGGAFRRVEIGASDQDVLSILGEPVERHVMPNSWQRNWDACWEYSYSPSDSHYRRCVIYFANSQVVDKRAEFYVD